MRDYCNAAAAAATPPLPHSPPANPRHQTTTPTTCRTPFSLILSLSKDEGKGYAGAKRPSPFDRLRMRDYGNAAA